MNNVKVKLYGREDIFRTMICVYTVNMLSTVDATKRDISQVKYSLLHTNRKPPLTFRKRINYAEKEAIFNKLKQ